MTQKRPDYEILEEISAHSGVSAWNIQALIVVVLVLGGIALWNIKPDGDNQITDYGRECQQSNVSAQNCTSWSLFDTTYILNKSAEEVVWYDGSGDAVRTNCHIGDTDNWYCDAYAGTALEGNALNVIGFAGGKSIESNPIVGVSGSYVNQHFGFWTYWWYKTLGWFGI